MFQKIWWFKKYWHVIALSSELNKNKLLKRKFYWIPLIILKNKENKVNVFFDFCPHKKAPLNIKNNEIVCNYHGWKFHDNWNIKDIPSSPHLKNSLKCSLVNIVSVEKNGFIWIYPDGKNKIENEIPDVWEIVNKKWNNYFKHDIFETNDDLLIENFMDSTHTPIVHNWLIRTNKTKTKHSIIIKQEKESIKAIFEETYENVWLGINYFIWNKLKISHTDEFIPPNLIKVNYKINQVDRFQAFIACTSYDKNKTIWFFNVSYNFWFLCNLILKIILPYISNKVLKQDFDITKLQFENKQFFEDISDLNIDYDLLHNKVKILKNKIKNNQEIDDKISINNINIYV